ncbi:8494_t:CDS:2, partial [Funneliformis geosporum]
KIIDTAMTLSFLRKTSSADSSPEVKEKYEKAKKYLISQIKDEKVEKELLLKTDQIVVEHATKKVIKEKANKVVIEKVQESVTVEESIKLQKLKIMMALTEDLGITTSKEISSIICVSDERVKKFDEKTWNTFITFAYCNKVLGKHETKWKVQNEKARKWIHEQIKDEKLEKEILESCEKVVVEKVFDKKSSWSPSVGGYLTSTTKYLDDTIDSTTKTITEGATHALKSVENTAALIILQSKTTPEATKKIVSTQKTDGSIKLDKQVSEHIDISSDELQKTVQSHGVSDKLKNISQSAWETALSLRYLTITSSKDQAEQHKDNSEKAKQYLINELKDENLVKELLTTSDKIIIEQSVQKEYKDAVANVQQSTSIEKVHDIISNQKMMVLTIDRDDL